MSAAALEGKTVPDDIQVLLENPATRRIVATVGPEGEASVQEISHGDLIPGPDGSLLLLEYFETSRLSRDLIHSLWFNHPIHLLLLADPERQYGIRGELERNYISGPVYQRFYRASLAKNHGPELAAVWVVRPTRVDDQSPAARRKAQQAIGFNFVHLDRLLPGTGDL